MSKLKSILKPLLLLLAGVVVGYGIGSLLSGKFSSWLPVQIRGASVWWFVPLLPLAFFAVIVVHELGHLAAAQLAGFRFRALTLGPLSLLKTPAGFRVRVNWQIMNLIGGQQISTPPQDGASDAGFMLYLAGGVVANFVTAALGAWWLHASVESPPLAMFLLLFVVVSVLLGAMNALPFHTEGGIATDGYNMRTLQRGGAAAERFRAMFNVLAYAYAGVRPRDWAQQTVFGLQNGVDAKSRGYDKATGPVVRLQWAMDIGNMAEAARAAQELEVVYADLQGPLRPHFAAELAYWYGVICSDIDAQKAERYAGDAVQSAYLISPSTVLRARAAAAYAAGQFDVTVALCEEGLAMAPNALNEFDRVMEPQWLQSIKAAAQAGAAKVQ
jgi:hypothetical protein